jgi:hypothetical protein
MYIDTVLYAIMKQGCGGATWPPSSLAAEQ